MPQTSTPPQTDSEAETGAFDEDARRGALLVELARHQLVAVLDPNNSRDHGRDLDAELWLHEEGAVFVTLRRTDGELRGCTGSIEAKRSLIEDLRANAVAAAVRDSRFPPVGPAELEELHIEVTQLTAPEPVDFEDEEDAIRQLRPGIDGVILSWSGHRATFLPQVWRQVPEPRDFLLHLKRKAGLALEFWAADLRLMRYRVRKWTDG